MRSVVESNNSFTKFDQVWAEQVFTDPISENPPDLSTAITKQIYTNKDGTTYTVNIFQITTDLSGARNYLMYISNFQLTKEFRQGRSWKLELSGNEEMLRHVILPGLTSSRGYTPTFTNGIVEIPYTSVDPDFDFTECRINVGLDFDKLYFTGWIYIGRNLKQWIEDNVLPPFDEDLWLIIDNKSGNRVRFNITGEKTYTLPGDDTVEVENDDTIITSSNINRALNNFGKLDEGEYW